jgi:hypothetical protein
MRWRGGTNAPMLTRASDSYPAPVRGSSSVRRVPEGRYLASRTAADLGVAPRPANPIRLGRGGKMTIIFTVSAVSLTVTLTFRFHRRRKR